MTHVGGGCYFPFLNATCTVIKNMVLNTSPERPSHLSFFFPLLSQTKLHTQLESVSDSHSHPLTTVYQKKKKKDVIPLTQSRTISLSKKRRADEGVIMLIQRHI